jgi:hypothetical protein
MSMILFALGVFAVAGLVFGLSVYSSSFTAKK